MIDRQQEYIKRHYDVVAFEVDGNGFGYRVLKDKTINKEIGDDVTRKSIEALKEVKRLRELILGETDFANNSISLSLTVGEDIHSALDVPIDFVERSGVESLSAAMLHEFVECWREDNVGIGEGVQLMVEFLFCGRDDGREDSYFGRMIDLFDDEEWKREDHVQGWKWITKEMGFNGGRNEMMGELKKFKDGMDEQQKIDYIKNRLLTLVEPSL